MGMVTRPWVTSIWSVVNTQSDPGAGNQSQQTTTAPGDRSSLSLRQRLAGLIGRKKSEPASSTPRDKRSSSLRRQVVGVAIAPSVLLIIFSVSVAAYGVVIGVRDREVAVGVREVSIPAVTGLASLQGERQLSMEYLGQNSKDTKLLVAQRQNTDKQLSEMRQAAKGLAAQLAPASINTKMAALFGKIDQLPRIRSEVDAHTTSGPEVYLFYNRLLDAATSLFDTQARIVPDTTALKGGIAATDMFRVSDLMSRAQSIITGAYASRNLDRQDFLEFADLVGAYHSQLRSIVPNLLPPVQTQSRILQTSDAWTKLVSAEQAILAHGQWTHRIPADLGVSATEWQSLTSDVASGLVNMTIKQATDVSADALSSGNTQLGVVSGGVLAIFLLVAAVIIFARRRALLLVSEALTSRLARLSDEAHVLVDERLPRILRSLRDGKRVDLGEELPETHHGEDEIGQLAASFHQALRAAVAGSVDMASAREHVKDVLLGIARRNQTPLHQQLSLLEKWEQKESSPELLDLLFSLDHGLNQIRKNTENMMLLVNARPGRRWRNPVPLRKILRQAISETTQYRRVDLEPVPDVQIIGGAVGEISHLIAELLDNALKYSNPEKPNSRVTVSSEQVPAGLVVEVEDRGLGMTPEDRARYNRALRESPEFDLLKLPNTTQLGFVVIARLARTLDIRVELVSTPYNGIKAIVLVPEKLIAPENSRHLGSRESRHEEAVIDQRRPHAGDGETTMEFAAVGARSRAATSQAGRSENYSLPRRPPQPHPSDNGPVGPDQRSFAPGRPSTDPAPAVNVSSGFTPEGTGFRQPAPSPQSIQAQPSSARPPEGRSGRPPLPERQPQKHMAPQLRGGYEDRSPEVDTEDLRTPEETRSRFSAFQRGTRDGRRDSE